jgi:uncharacterized OB-fold protein
MSGEARGAPGLRFEPPASAVSEPFWEATRERRLVVQWCTSCERPVFFPRAVCPGCLGTALEWRPSAGVGTVYAVTVEHRPQNPQMAAMTPYAVALVELEEGIRMLTNVVGGDPGSVAVGDAVAVTWGPLSDGRHLPLFTPVTGTRDGDD